MVYELMVIVSPTSGSGAVSTKLEKVLKDGSATDVKVNNLGKKQLAYPIRKYSEAEYLVYNFEAPGEITKALSEMIRVEQEMILRYLLTKPKISKATPKPRFAKRGMRHEAMSVVEEVKPKAKVTVRTKTVAVPAKEQKALKETKGTKTMVTSKTKPGKKEKVVKK